MDPAPSQPYSGPSGTPFKCPLGPGPPRDPTQEPLAD